MGELKNLNSRNFNDKLRPLTLLGSLEMKFTSMIKAPGTLLQFRMSLVKSLPNLQ